MMRINLRVSAILFVFLFAVGHCRAQVASVEVPALEVPTLEIESYRLPNGLKVALNHDPTAPQTAVCVTYHVGSKNERTGLTGFAHFFEHMMFRGTENVPSFDRPLQQAGGSPNAFTTQDVTVYFETIPSNYLELTLYMEAERMAFLPTALDATKFDTEREIVKNERRQRMENVPYGLSSETISSHVFPQGHPYSWSVIGSMEDLNNSDLGDLRRFFYEFYHPNNATLCIVGSFDPEKTKSWIEKYFGVLAPGPDVKEVETTELPAVSKTVIQRDQVQFPRTYWAWPTIPETHADASALELLGNLLSDGDASRLHQALIIDQQSATSVNARSDVREIGGLFTMDAIVAPGHDIADVERTFQREIERLRDAPPSQAEIDGAIRKDQKRSLVQLTGTTGRAFAIAMGFAQFGNPHYYQDVYRNYSSVTPADVQRVARKYLTDERLVLHILPISEGESETPAILAGPLPADQTPQEIAARVPNSSANWEKRPDAEDHRDFEPPNFSVHRLNNGLNVWIAPWRTLPLVTARLVVPTGGAEVPIDKAGLAKLTATLWEKGTADLTATEFAQALDGLGTSIGIGASFSTTELGFTVVKEALPEALRLVGSMVASPRFDAEDFQRERALQLTSLTRGPDNPSWISSRVMPGLIYGREHPYGVPTSGYKESVTEVSLDDVKQFYARNYLPSDSTLIVAGDVDVNSFLKQVESSWGKWQGGAATKSVTTPTTPPAARTVYVIDKPGAVQSIVSVGRLWRPRQDPSHLAATIGNRVLGGDYTSRINKNLREKNGYTYGAYSQFDHIRETGDWTVSSKIRADVTGAAIREVVNELSAMHGDRPLTESEIAVSRAALLNTFPAKFESPQQISASIAAIARHDLPKSYLNDFAKRLRDVSDASVIQVTAELCDVNQMRTLIVGDRKQVVPQLKEAGFERIHFLDENGKAID